jgi:hypothetical protein
MGRAPIPSRDDDQELPDMARPPENDLTGNTGTTTVSYAVLDAARDKVNDLAAQFGNTVPEVGAGHDRLLSGAGELGAHLQVGAVKFLIAWREAFTVCSQSAGLVAGNTHNYSMDLAAVDVGQQVKVTI